jgi:hypothetical protein
MTWVITTFDPDYLTEPVVRSVTYIRAPTVQIPPYPCAAQQEEYRAEDLAGKYRVPNFLIGENPFLSEVAFKYQVPLEGVRGGAETLYPEWRAKGMSMAAPTVQAKIVPVYTDIEQDRRVADAQPRRSSAMTRWSAACERQCLYAGRGGANIALSVGGDGIVMVDSGAGRPHRKVWRPFSRSTR